MLNHLIFVLFADANRRIFVLIAMISFSSDSRRFCWIFVQAANEQYATDQLMKFSTKLKPLDEILVIPVLTKRIFFIDLLIDSRNVPFHLKLTDSSVDFNSKRDSSWENEINLMSSSFPINSTVVIELLINRDEGFNISINKQNSFRTLKRQSLDGVKEVRVYGNFTLISLKIIQPARECQENSEDSSKQTYIIGIAISCVLLIIAVLGIFYMLRRQCLENSSKKSSKYERDPAAHSLTSYNSDRTGLSNGTFLTGNVAFPL